MELQQQPCKIFNCIFSCAALLQCHKICKGLLSLFTVTVYCHCKGLLSLQRCTVTIYCHCNGVLSQVLQRCTVYCHCNSVLSQVLQRVAVTVYCHCNGVLSQVLQRFSLLSWDLNRPEPIHLLASGASGLHASTDLQPQAGAVEGPESRPFPFESLQQDPEQSGM